MFSQVIYSNEMEHSNPAAIDLDTGILYLNNKNWFKMDKQAKKQILLHELGHYKLQTKDEFKADDFSFKNYIKYGGSPIASIKGISEVLTDDTQEQIARLNHRIKQAKQIDKTMTNAQLKYTGTNTGVLDPKDPTGNTVLVPPAEFNAMVSGLEREEEALALEESILNEEIGDIIGTLSSLVKSIDDAERIAKSNCLQQKNNGNDACKTYKRSKNEANCKVGVAKAYNECMNSIFDTDSDLQTQYTANVEKKLNKSRAKADVRRMRAERKAMIAEAKAYKKITKANGKSYKMMTNADANLVLAGQGIDSKGNMVEAGMKGLSSVADSVASIWGGGTGNAYGSGGGGAPQNNNMMLIIIAAVVLGGLYFFTQKKTK